MRTINNKKRHRLPSSNIAFYTSYLEAAGLDTAGAEDRVGQEPTAEEVSSFYMAHFSKELLYLDPDSTVWAGGPLREAILEDAECLSAAYTSSDQALREGAALEECIISFYDVLCERYPDIE
jgi:hypothetical protein